MKEEKNTETSEIKAEAMVLTGVALVGGTKLVYEVGKDLYSKLKPEQKLFIQLLRSDYIDKHHVIQARLANAHIHSLQIESLVVTSVNNINLISYENKGRKIGMGAGEDEKPFEYPYILEPSKSLDLIIEIPEISNRESDTNNGIELKYSYSSLAVLGESEKLDFSVRLLWTPNAR